MVLLIEHRLTVQKHNALSVLLGDYRIVEAACCTNDVKIILAYYYGERTQVVCI